MLPKVTRGTHVSIQHHTHELCYFWLGSVSQELFAIFFLCSLKYFVRPTQSACSELRCSIHVLICTFFILSSSIVFNVHVHAYLLLSSTQRSWAQGTVLKLSRCPDSSVVCPTPYDCYRSAFRPQPRPCPTTSSTVTSSGQYRPMIYKLRLVCC